MEDARDGATIADFRVAPLAVAVEAVFDELFALELQEKNEVRFQVRAPSFAGCRLAKAEQGALCGPIGR